MYPRKLYKRTKIFTNPDGTVKEVRVAEATILTHILGWFLTNNYIAWRNNSGSVFTRQNRFIRLAPPGSPDIIAVDKKTGKFIGVEVKQAKAYQNANQKMFQKQLEESHGIYIVARSIKDVTEALGEHKDDGMLD